MRKMLIAGQAILAYALAAPGALAQSASAYVGPCDASAAAALDTNHFIAANDDDNTLRVYRLGVPDAVGEVPLSAFLQSKKEADIEGAARIGGRIYWIGSHGMSQKGEARPAHRRFFATDVRAGSPPSVEKVGQPYTGLVRDLEETPELKQYGLGAAANMRPETEAGLNIEGLAATPDGRLLIGLRNPLAKDRALVIPLENPAEVINGKPARLGKAIELDLGKRGIRSIELVGTQYYIVAGSTGDRGDFALFRWSGKPDEKAVQVKGAEFGDLRPEGLIQIPGSTRLLLLSDDGGISGVECKKREPQSTRGFRTLTVTPEER